MVGKADDRSDAHPAVTADDTHSRGAEREVVQLCSELIRIDSVNTGDPDTIGDGEARAARYVQQKLDEVGYETTYVESVPGRGNVICRLAGADPGARRAADPRARRRRPRRRRPSGRSTRSPGAVRDGYVWGRGAVDMKDMVAMIVAVAREFKTTGYVPPRDLIFAFMSDEEAGGDWGRSGWSTTIPNCSTDATEAISEVGGFSIPIADDRRAYLVAAAEKGVAWAHLTATGRAGHGSMINDDNAVSRIAEAVVPARHARVPDHPHRDRRRTARQDHRADRPGVPGAEDLESAVAKVGPVARIVNATLRNTANPTMLKAGYKANVIPSTASATVDCRVLPGSEDTFRDQVAQDRR